MARLPRLSLAGHPHSIIQRAAGDRQVFARDEDYDTFLRILAENAHSFNVAIHAFVLLDNQIQLLVTPDTPDAIASLMQATGRRFVRHLNRIRQTRGSPWEGRYRSTLVQPAAALLSCMAYIDLAPVRSSAVEMPGDYRWSSHGHYTGLRKERWITPHRLVWELGNTPFAREAAYAGIVGKGIGADEQARIADATLRGWVLGDENYANEVQSLTSRPVARRLPGRPLAAIRSD